MLAGVARAETVRVIGSAVKVSCGTWLQDRQAKKSFDLQQWVLGYLSGAATYGDNLNPLNDVDAPAVWYWMDNYCKANPLIQIPDAIDAFIKEHPR